MKRISVTKINTYRDCPRKFWYSYDMRILTPKTEGYFFGSAIHTGLEDYYNRKDPMQGIANALFGKKSNIGEEAKEGMDLHKLHKEAERIFDIYPKQATKFKPLLVEHFFEVPLVHPETKEKLPCLFVGKMDLVTKDGIVVDHKTAGSKGNGFWLFERRNRLQASGYAYAYFMKYGKLPSKFVYNFIIKGNTRREPEVETKDYAITLDDLCFFFDTCKEVLGAIVRGETRNFTDTRHCRWCNYKDICSKGG